MSITTESAPAVDITQLEPLPWLRLVDTTRQPGSGDEFLVTGAHSQTQDIGRILTHEGPGTTLHPLQAKPDPDRDQHYCYAGAALNPPVARGDVIGIVRDTPDDWRLPSKRGDVLTVTTGSISRDGATQLGTPNGVIGASDDGRHRWAGAYVKLTAHPGNPAEPVDTPHIAYTDTTTIPYDVMVTAIRKAAEAHGLERDGERFIVALGYRYQLGMDADVDLQYVVRDHWGDPIARFVYQVDAGAFLDGKTSSTQRTYTVAELRDRVTGAAAFFGWCGEALREFDKAFGPTAGTWRVEVDPDVDDDVDEGLAFDVRDPDGQLVASFHTRTDADAYVDVRKSA